MKYCCKVYWQMSGEVTVEADTPEAASELAIAGPLPTDCVSYVSESCDCDPTSDVQEVQDAN